MLRETQTNRKTDRIESIGSAGQSGPNWLKDTTEGEVLVWKRPSKENLVVKHLTEATKILGHAVTNYTKKTEKNIKKMKKRF